MDLAKTLSGTVLRCVPAAEIERIAEQITVRRLARGDILFHEGCKPGSLDVVLCGHVELSTGQLGAASSVLLVPEGEIVSPAAGLVDFPHAETAHTVEGARILSIRKQALRRLDELPKLREAIVSALVVRKRLLERHLVELKCRSASQRLAWFLLEIVNGGRNPDGAELPCPKRSLASLIGVTPETLSRSLQVIARRGLVVRGTRIIVRNRSMIESFCLGERRMSRDSSDVDGGGAPPPHDWWPSAPQPGA